MSDPPQITSNMETGFAKSLMVAAVGAHRPSQILGGSFAVLRKCIMFCMLLNL